MKQLKVAWRIRYMSQLCIINKQTQNQIKSRKVPSGFAEVIHLTPQSECPLRNPARSLDVSF